MVLKVRPDHDPPDKFYNQTMHKKRLPEIGLFTEKLIIKVDSVNFRFTKNLFHKSCPIIFHSRVKGNMKTHRRKK